MLTHCTLFIFAIRSTRFMDTMCAHYNNKTLSVRCDNITIDDGVLLREEVHQLYRVVCLGMFW